MADVSAHRNKVAKQVHSILLDYPHSIAIFRKRAREFCAEYQRYFDAREKVDPAEITDEEAERETWPDIDEMALKTIPRDPIRGGMRGAKYFRLPATKEEELNEQYTALAVLHDDVLREELQESQVILADKSWTCLTVQKLILGNKTDYNEKFYQDAVEAVKADLASKQKEQKPIEGSGEMDTSEILIRIQRHIDFFREQWDKFCEMIEKYGQHVENCQNDPKLRVYAPECDSLVVKEFKLSQECNNIDNQISGAFAKKDQKEIERLSAILKERQAEKENLEKQITKLTRPQPGPGYVKFDFKGFAYLNLPPSHIFWISPGPPNPLWWTDKEINAGQQEPPGDIEQRMCDCVLLSIYHDNSTAHSEPKIYHHTAYKGAYFKCDEFVFQTTLFFKEPECIEKVTRAWERVKADLPKEPAEPKPTAASGPIEGQVKMARPESNKDSRYKDVRYYYPDQPFIAGYSVPEDELSLTGCKIWRSGPLNNSEISLLERFVGRSWESNIPSMGGITFRYRNTTEAMAAWYRKFGSTPKAYSTTETKEAFLGLLKSKLRRCCNIQNPDPLTWGEIFTAINEYVSGKQEKGGQTTAPSGQNNTAETRKKEPYHRIKNPSGAPLAKAVQMQVTLQSQFYEALQGIPEGREYMLKLAEVMEGFADERIGDELEYFCLNYPQPFSSRVSALFQLADSLFWWMRKNALSGIADALERDLHQIANIARKLDASSPPPPGITIGPDARPEKLYAGHVPLNADLKKFAHRLRDVASDGKTKKRTQKKRRKTRQTALQHFSYKNQVPWDAKDQDYYPNTEAIADATRLSGKHDIKDLKYLDYDKLKKLLRQPECTIKFMSRKSPPRGKVHKQQWQKWLQAQVKQAEKIDDVIEQEVTKRIS